MLRHLLLSCSFLLPASLMAGAAQAEPPRVVSDIPPVHGLVARVMQGVSEPQLLVRPGASPHSYSLRPSDARALSDADLVVWVGPALEPWLEGPLDELAAGAHQMRLLDLPDTLRLEFREGAVFSTGGEDHDEGQGHEDAHDRDHDHEDAHGHEDAHEGDHDHEDAHDHEEAHDHDHDHGHDHHGVDPHAWLAPQNGKQWLVAIADELAELDPENAQLYRNNAAEGAAEIDAVVAALQGELGAQTGQFVVFHDAYQYFEQAFGLNALGAISLGDASDPSPARLDALRDALLSAEASCVFAEPQFNPGLVQAVIGTSDMQSAVIDPLGTKIETGADFYPELLRSLGGDMASCLARVKP